MPPSTTGNVGWIRFYIGDIGFGLQFTDLLVSSNISTGPYAIVLGADPLQGTAVIENLDPKFAFPSGFQLMGAEFSGANNGPLTDPEILYWNVSLQTNLNVQYYPAASKYTPNTLVIADANKTNLRFNYPDPTQFQSGGSTLAAQINLNFGPS